MADSQSTGSDAFRWLDQHMIESAVTPDEAFDWVYMTRPQDWLLFEAAWGQLAPQSLSGSKYSCANRTFGGGTIAMSGDRSLLGLDEPHSILEKLGLFLSTLLIGPIIAALIFLGVQYLEPPWRDVAIWVSESLAVFWICLLVFIWWRPPWFRRIYLTFERKVVIAVRIIGFGFFIYFAVIIFIGWLRAMHFD